MTALERQATLADPNLHATLRAGDAHHFREGLLIVGDMV